jgi:aspartate racemase
MAISGIVTPAHRDLFFAASRRIIAETGAEAILLGGTDLDLAFSGQTLDFDVIDCAVLHIDALVRLAAQ